MGSSVGDLRSVSIPCIFDLVCETLTTDQTLTTDGYDYDAFPSEGFLFDLRMDFDFNTIPVNVIFDAPEIVLSAWVQVSSVWSC